MKKTHEQYLEELINKNIQAIPLETYVDSATKIKHKCLIHDKEFFIRPNHLLRGGGCPQCSAEKTRKAFAKTHEAYANELQEKGIKYIPLERYINNKTNILHKCFKCGYEWRAKPDNILKGSGCPKCSGNIGKTPEEYAELVRQNNPNIELLEKYDTSNRHIKCRCIKHDYIWDADAYNISRGGGCRFCQREKINLKRQKPHQQFIDEMKEINSNIEILGIYAGNKNKIHTKCLICGNEWNPISLDLIRGRGCPQCNKSNGENRIELWLSKNNISYISQYRFPDCVDKYPLPFDFYIVTGKCIEFDGIQHFEPVERFGGQKALEYTQRHDRIKNEYCKVNNIPLLRIPYYANVEEELEKFLA